MAESNDGDTLQNVATANEANGTTADALPPPPARKAEQAGEDTAKEPVAKGREDDLYADIAVDNKSDRKDRDRGRHEDDDKRSHSDHRDRSRRSEDRGSDREKHKSSRSDRDRDHRRSKDRDERRSTRDDRDRRREPDRDGPRREDPREDRDRERRRDADRDRDRDRRRESDREPDRERSRRDRDRPREHSESDRRRDRDREYERRGRDDDERDGRGGRRPPSRDRGSRDRDRGVGDRDRRRDGDDARDRQGPAREERRRDRDDERGDGLVLGGYRPRKRSGGPIIPQVVDPFAAVRAKNAAQGMSVTTFEAAAKVQKELQAKARQMVLQQQATSAAAAASKTQREVYIGNLQQGKVTEVTLRQLFDEALSSAFPHLCVPGLKPCNAVSMHSEGRYAFVELATPEMATAALQLSGQLNFLGSQMTVGRPSGYIDPGKAAAAAAAASKALLEFNASEGFATVLEKGAAPPASDVATECVCIDNMAPATVFTSEEEFQELSEDLREECSKHGDMVDTRIPRPDAQNPDARAGEGCYGKVYVLMGSVTAAANVKTALHGRLYDGNNLEVTYIQPAHFYMLPTPVVVP